MCIQVLNEETKQFETKHNCKECEVNRKNACPWASVPFGKDYEELKLF